MIRVVCELGIVQDDQRTDLLRVVDQMAGPQTLLPQLVSFQAGRHARAAGALRGAAARLRGLHGRQPRAAPRGDRSAA